MQYAKAQYLFILTAVIVLLFGWLNSSWQLDVNMNDTYHIIGWWWWSVVPALLLIGYAVIYELFDRYKKPVNRVIALSHVLLSVLFISAALYAGTFYDAGPRRYYSFIRKPPIFNEQALVLFAITVLLLSVLVFLIGIISALVKGKVSVR